jgi:hypothetical protein
MIAINSVLIPIDASEQTLITESCVVVYGDQLRDKVFVINLEGRAKKPIALPYSLLLEWVNDKIIGLATLEKPAYFQLSDNLLPEKTIIKREARWSAISPLIFRLEEFLMADYGSKLVSETACKAKKTRDQIYQWFYQYLRLGQTKTALTPNYTNTGSVERKTQQKKIGAPRQNNHGVIGKNVIQQDKDNIHKIIKKHYWTENGLSLTQCLVELNLQYYASGRSISQNGQINISLLSEDERITINQLRYWEKNIAKEKGINSLAERHGKTRYKKDLQGRTSNPEVAIGPGHIYQIDATPFDFEAVSEFSKDRDLMVGRPTIYWIRDVFSSSFVGLHVTLAAPSWHTMRLALFNTFRGKQNYCADYGIKIDESDWPQQGYCIKLVGDNAELTSDLSASILKDTGVTVRFAREYRGDDKGLDEQSFNLHNEFFKGRLPGEVSKISGDRGTKDPKLDAKLMVNEIAKICIQYAIHFNNAQLINANNFDKSIVSAGIKLTPNSIWKWGVKNRPFYRKAYDERSIYLDLLEAGEVTLTRKGIIFKGLIYQSLDIQKSGLLDRKVTANKSSKIECRFMRHNMNHIWLLLPEGKVVAALGTHSRRFENCSLDEVESQLKTETLNIKQHLHSYEESAASLSINIQGIVKKASKEQTVITKNIINKQSVSKNKAADIEAENHFESNRFEMFSSEVQPDNFDETSEIKSIPNSQQVKITEKNKSQGIFENTMQQLLKGDKK